MTNLLPASFRGVPFAIVDQSVQTGRRIAMHEYPGRDTPWAEDMGRAAQRWRVRGFILENDPVYAGGPIELQRAALLAAAKAKGSGLLTHPTLGLLTVACDRFSLSESIDGATYSEVEFGFVEAGKQSLPSLLTDSIGIPAEVLAAASAVAGVVRKIGLAGRGGSGNASGILPAATGAWSDKVMALGNDATALHRLASALPGNLGRYSRGATTGFLTQIDTGTTDTLPQLVNLAASQRAAIVSAAGRLNDVVAALTVTADEGDYADAATRLVAALAAACADPADALRLLGELLLFAPTAAWAGSLDATAVGMLFQRVAAIEFARAITAYQPASYDDAFDHLVWATGVVDTAILAAGDAGQDELYAALRDLRAQIVTDLNARGASLAHVTTVRSAKPLPALALAQRLYRDGGRGDELVGQVPGCVSPLFMPVEFKALAA